MTAPTWSVGNNGSDSAGSQAPAISGTNNPVGSIVVVLVQSANEAVSANDMQSLYGWNPLPGIGAGTGYGTAGTNSANRLTGWWFPGTGLAQTSKDVGDYGDHSVLFWFTLTGADLVNPINASLLESVTTSSTSMNWGSVTTTVSDCLIIHAVVTGQDTSTLLQTTASATNSNLTSLTNRVNVAYDGNDGTASGAGGTQAQIWTGVKATAGATGTTTATAGAAVKMLKYTIAIQPAQPPVPMGVYWTY